MKTETIVKHHTHSFPLLGLLGVAFVVLKLCGVIGWSWWLVTLPFWGGLALILGFLLLVGVVAACSALAVFLFALLRRK